MPAATLSQWRETFLTSEFNGLKSKGTDATSMLTAEGKATVFIMFDHCTRECLGLHAARRGTRFEALEVVHQAVHHFFGVFKEGIAGA